MREKMLNLMKSESLTSSRLAEILEIQPSGVSHILSGRNKPGFDLLQKILRRFPRINPDWLLLDSDIMYRDNMDCASASNITARTMELSDNTKSATESGVRITKNEDVHSAVDATASNRENIIVRKATQTNVERVVIFYDDHTFESFSNK